MLGIDFYREEQKLNDTDFATKQFWFLLLYSLCFIACGAKSQTGGTNIIKLHY